MKKSKIIFVHGGQGSGKSTLTNLLRESMTHCTLLRLAGVSQQQENPANESLRYHYAMLEGMNLSLGSGMNFIVDRSFLCEKVYANLNYKPYNFEEEYNIISSCVETLAERFDVYFVLLTAQKDTFIERLNQREKVQFEDVIFDADNSLKQQKEYEKEFEKLPLNVKKIVLKTDNNTTQSMADFILNSIK